MHGIINLYEEYCLPVGASCIELFEITQNFGSLVLKLSCVVLGLLLMK